MADSRHTNNDDNNADAVSRATDNLLGPNPFVGMRPEEMLEVAQTMMLNAVTNPLNFMKHAQSYFGEMMRIMTNTSEISPDRGDRRFADPVWNDNPMYRVVLQSYLAARRELNEWVDGTDLASQDRDRAKFVMSLLTEGLSPSNSSLNPAALKRMFETGGSSVKDGLKNMVDDFIHEGGMPSMVDKSAFSVGENLATTAGSVIFRNDVLELIQYKPLTAEVYERPMMVVPPQINKFYIFDLSPHNSLVKYALENGQQVFMVSWRNPTSEHKDWGMDTYIGALIEAIEVVCAITRSSDLNLLGACSGGITSATLLAYLAATGNSNVNSMTLLVSVFDTSIETQIGMFANNVTLEAAKARSATKGILPGREMGRVFAWMRPNDLVWNYWVNNYLLGNKPPAFDVLYWNSDTTNLPGRFHGQLLDLFRDNSLVEAGGLEVDGVAIDLSKITCDFYSLAGTTDHITPWDACYASTHLLGGPCTFVLSSSGHIQSIINPPGNPKAKFSTNNARPDDAQTWREGATEQIGSWWDHWHQWLGERSGSKKAARKTLGNKKYPALAKAPGTYVYE